MTDDPCPWHPTAIQVRGLCSACTIRSVPGEAPHRIMARYYRNRIEAGVLMPGQRIPSVSALMKQWGVANTTAHKALKELQSGGYVFSSRTGSFVYQSGIAEHRPETLAQPVTGARGCRGTVHCACFGFCDQCAPELAKAGSHIIEALNEIGRGEDGTAYGRVMSVLRDMEKTTHGVQG